MTTSTAVTASDTCDLLIPAAWCTATCFAAVRMRDAKPPSASASSTSPGEFACLSSPA
eukprot:CAMPEP_0194316452 /NCGR_PEP_ID=MMETSP0171-20130528/13253_1 /TAXON_ID=218684 /ORGANISM="Corethron pennatum, Strain L29A3" /LENGTH=57 /DNA_ID=CAMNT_0039072689 /DNA_START=266 /DNA_END=435 /DNA_ORIENTATION=-